MQAGLKDQILIVGFGSQARAWAYCLKQSGFEVHLALRNLESSSAQEAKKQGHAVLALEASAHFRSLAASVGMVAFLFDDGAIGECYQQFFRPIESPMLFVLAHGFAKFSGQLNDLSPMHSLALFAPKAIGPKIRENYDLQKQHSLKAAVQVQPQWTERLAHLRDGLGFAASNCIPASFETETLGDLISEQGLLCGTVFSALLETAETMIQAGVPGALVREECITELELIASMLRNQGPANTFGNISQVAQFGTVEMFESLSKQPLSQVLKVQVSKMKSGQFVSDFKKGSWKKEAESISARLRALENQLEGRS